MFFKKPNKNLTFVLLLLILLAGSSFTFYKFKTYLPTVPLATEGGKVSGAKSTSLLLTYPNAKIISENLSNKSIFITQKTKDNPEEIINFYNSILTESGWKKKKFLLYKRENKEISISLTKDANNDIIIQASYSLVPTK